MNAPLPPAWLADDPYPPGPNGGPHWAGCERVHPSCAWKAGVRHGQLVTAHFLTTLTRSGDSAERARTLDEAARMAQRLAGPDPAPPPATALNAELARLDAAEAREREQEQIDRDALSGASADEAAHL